MAVYLVRAGYDGPVKIGVADVVEERLRDLQTAHYADLNLLRVLDGDRELEQRLHAHYRPLRVRGEWHRYCPTMLTIEAHDLAPAAPPVRADAPIIRETDNLLPQIEAFLSERSMSASAFGRLAVNDPHLVHDLRRGRDCLREVRGRVRGFIAAVNVA